MIRRNPTLIPMSDLDVQDVRDLVAQQKADTLHAHHKAASAKAKRMAAVAAAISAETSEQFLANLRNAYVADLKTARAAATTPQTQAGQSATSTGAGGRC
jgi:predicted Zn-dependent protease